MPPGVVNPTLDLKAITPSDADAFIDEFIAGVTTVNAGGNCFHDSRAARAFTVNVNGQTEWEGSETISDLTSTSIVSISGTLDRTDGTFVADTVAILSQDKFYAGGLITYVDPPTGTAQDFDLYVRDVLPAGGTGFTSGQISTIDLDGQREVFHHLLDAQCVRQPAFEQYFLQLFATGSGAAREHRRAIYEWHRDGEARGAAT